MPSILGLIAALAVLPNIGGDRGGGVPQNRMKRLWTLKGLAIYSRTS